MDVPWSVVVRKSRKATDMRPSKIAPTKQVHAQSHHESMCRRVGSVSSAIESVDINVVQESPPRCSDPDWERIPVKIDSGAIDMVIPTSVAQGVKMVHTESSRNRPGFRAANGTPIEHYGQKAIAR